jgi:hypothetical protein
MIRKISSFGGSAMLILAAVLLLQTAALAGPPLLCHPFHIGGAKSLPFQGPGWSQVSASYDAKRLVDDTLALLTPEVPVIVRMETLRRATIYARADEQLAATLLQRVKARADEIKDPKRSDRAALMAWFDAGYLAETYREAARASHFGEAFWAFKQQDPKDIDGYALIMKALERGGGPEMEFAAALVTSEKRDRNHYDHVQKAAAAATPGSLLAENVAAEFPDAAKTARLSPAR